MTNPGVHDARAADAALRDATAARDRLAGRARWAQRHHLLLASYWSVTVLLFGLLPPLVPDVLGGYGALFPILAVVALAVGVDRWAERRTVVVRGHRRLEGISRICGPLYIVVLAVGFSRFPGDPAFWLPAALVVAVPSLVAAALARRATLVRLAAAPR